MDESHYALPTEEQLAIGPGDAVLVTRDDGSTEFAHCHRAPFKHASYGPWQLGVTPEDPMGICISLLTRCRRAAMSCDAREGRLLEIRVGDKVAVVKPRAVGPWRYQLGAVTKITTTGYISVAIAGRRPTVFNYAGWGRGGWGRVGWDRVGWDRGDRYLVPGLEAAWPQLIALAELLHLPLRNVVPMEIPCSSP